MRIVRAARIATLTASIAATWPVGTSSAQGVGSAPSIESINAEYERDLLKIERQRLEHLGKLALAQPKDKADALFDMYFRLAIAKNLYADAAPIAKRVIQAEGNSTNAAWLAHLVQIVGEADKGDYEGSLKSLAAAIRLKGQDPKDSGLPLGTKASIIDAYYQRLLHADQVEVARKAMKLIVDNADAPAIKDLAQRRLKQLDLVGQMAPPIAGTDLDGKPFNLADPKGDVVLVVFWATWCLPNAQEMPYLEYIHRTFHGKGFKIVGINLDSPKQAGPALQTVMPNIHRFLIDHNVTWPTLVNGPGAQDYADAFSVTEIPASVLIGRDGKVRHLDLTGRRLEKAIAEAVAQKP